MRAKRVLACAMAVVLWTQSFGVAGADGKEAENSPAGRRMAVQTCAVPDAAVTAKGAVSGAAVSATSVKRLKKVKKVSLIRYSTHSVKVTWKPVRKNVWYRVCVSEHKAGPYRRAAVTKDTRYRLKKLKNKTKYYVKVQAVHQKKQDTAGDGRASDVVSIKTRPYQRMTILAGDSITKGVADYNLLPQFGIGGKKKVVAEIGLGTLTYRTKRCFGGKSGIQKVVEAKPYRVYIMLGMNEIHYRRPKDMIAAYKELIATIKADSPQTDIVILPVSPVTAATQQKVSGYWQIGKYNRMLRRMAAKQGLHYFDYTQFLKDRTGHLVPAYAPGDGIHWTPSVYARYIKKLEKYDKSLD